MKEKIKLKNQEYFDGSYSQKQIKEDNIRIPTENYFR